MSLRHCFRWLAILVMGLAFVQLSLAGLQAPGWGRAIALAVGVGCWLGAIAIWTLAHRLP